MYNPSLVGNRNRADNWTNIDLVTEAFAERFRNHSRLGHDVTKRSPVHAEVLRVDATSFLIFMHGLGARKEVRSVDEARRFADQIIAREGI